ncbi:TniQ family protein [Cohnella lubricantis]|uniref:TniQ family protein n=1 Tax=Cohnella lubricantis TaxID=2163172 RepID=A0A841T9A5_9BACL|nr:TniQ family protein [Cohnella lubricantis]
MDTGCVLPNPYPDELLYSVIARYHVRMNNESPKWTLREVFGTENVIPTIDLPSHLDSLVSRNLTQGLTANQWIDRHTLYPYYAPFLPKDRAYRVRALMKSTNGSGIHALIGITASTVERSNDLRYCPSCFESDIQHYGEPYWHRLHQMSGVWVCPLHQVDLHRIIEPISDRHGLTVLPIARSMFRSEPVMKMASEKIKTILCQIAEDVRLLIENSESLTNLYNLRDHVLPRLFESGYVTAGARIRQRKFYEQFTITFGEELLRIMDSTLSGEVNSWTATAVRKARYVVHPVRSLLLVRFLYGSLEQFLSVPDSSYTPFGLGPWPCLNKASDHYHRAVVTSLQVTRCTDTSQPVGTFTCNCGFSYSRRGPDQCNEDKYRRGRIKSFGPVWAKKLRELLHEGKSIRTIADLLGVDSNTVIKYARGAVVDSLKNNSTETPQQKGTEKPGRLEQSQRQYNDRVNWEKRDLELSWLVEEACKAMLSDETRKPTRITLSAVGKKVGKLSLLEKRKKKIPITMQVLSRYLESVKDFQIRRVRWAADQMAGEWPLRKWKLVKKAGLWREYDKEVSEEIDRCIGLHVVGLNEVNQSWLH